MHQEESTLFAERLSRASERLGVIVANPRNSGVAEIMKHCHHLGIAFSAVVHLALHM